MEAVLLEDASALSVTHKPPEQISDHDEQHGYCFLPYSFRHIDFYLFFFLKYSFSLLGTQYLITSVVWIVSLLKD